MSFRIAYLAAAVLAMTASAAGAAVIDGALDAGYGAPKSTVGFDAGAPLGNFGSPGPTNHLAGYNIYMLSTPGAVNVLLRADRVSGLPFANLYWDLDPQNGNGSDLGFEVTNNRAFIPGKAGYSGPLGLTFATSGDGMGVEVSFANSLFTSAIAGLDYWAGRPLPGIGDNVTLRLSQAFGYSVAGGASYGPDRLGTVSLAGAVPEPASWAMLIAGFGLVGAVARNRAGSRPVVAA